MPFSYKYPRPSVTCDAVIFTMRADDLALLLIQRKDEPFKGKWALPGGFVNENEALDRAAARELREETGLAGAKLEQVGAFGDPGRDPRGHTVTVAYMTFFATQPKVSAGDDAVAAEWHPLRSLALEPAAPKTKGKTKRSKPKIELAFDHAKIIDAAYKRLCQHLDEPLNRERRFEILPSRFTLTELQHFYEIVLKKSFQGRAFKKLMIDRAFIVPTTSKPTQKPAQQLYRWNRLK